MTRRSPRAGGSSHERPRPAGKGRDLGGPGAYRGTTMYVHFRETPYGLAMSLVESRREKGKVRHEHVASLGSIETPLSVAARIEFWRGLQAAGPALQPARRPDARQSHRRGACSRPYGHAGRATRFAARKGEGGCRVMVTDFLTRRRWPCPQEKHNNRAAEITQPPHRAAVGDNGCSRLWRLLERANDFAKASRVGSHAAGRSSREHWNLARTKPNAFQGVCSAAGLARRRRAALRRGLFCFSSLS